MSGSAGSDLNWVILAGVSDEHFMTMLLVSRAGRQVAGSGFGGPKLYPGSVMNEWRGKTDDLPYFVMARTAIEVDRVVAITDRGTEVVLALSPIFGQFGLRFAATALPAGEGPGFIRAEVEGRIVETSPQPMPPRTE